MPRVPGVKVPKMVKVELELTSVHKPKITENNNENTAIPIAKFAFLFVNYIHHYLKWSEYPTKFMLNEMKCSGQVFDFNVTIFEFWY